MNENKLYMVLLGCRPKGRWTEQHDIFFGIGTSLKSLVPAMKASWPESNGKIHIDAWRVVTKVDQFTIKINPRTDIKTNENGLFFINLGGYKENEFEEYHYKMVTVAPSKALAIKQSKQTAFFKHCGFKGAVSHIDDKYGIDVDDAFAINEMLPKTLLNDFQIDIALDNESLTEDEWHIGYVKIADLKEETK